MKIILRLDAEDMQTFEAKISVFKITKPIYRDKSEARVIYNDIPVDTIEIDKEDVDAVALDDFKQILEWMDEYLHKQTILAKDLTRNTIEYLFRTEEGREKIKEMLKNGANKNKDNFKGKARTEFFNILEAKFLEVAE